jgi:hypothetical protein
LAIGQQTVSISPTKIRLDLCASWTGRRTRVGRPTDHRPVVPPGVAGSPNSNFHFR